MDPAKWILWDIPTNAEWSIELLQMKASVKQKQTNQEGCATHEGNLAEIESSSSDYKAAPISPQCSTLDAEEALHHTEMFKFRAWQATIQGHIMISRSGIRFSLRV
jgi:hypothetical protein